MANDAWTNRSWQIVRADVDLSHVFLPPNALTFVAAERDGVQGYTLSQAGAGQAHGCFTKTFLVPEGSSMPGLQVIDQKSQPLPVLTQADADQYADLFDKIETYVNDNDELLRLVGDIEIPCHATQEQLTQNKLEAHAPRTITTTIHVYQVSNAVTGNRPLLFVQAQVTPPCLANGNGTVIGYA